MTHTIKHTIKHFDKRVLILGLIFLLLTISFWASSRYPALDAKALMGGSIVLEDSLSFDAIYSVVDQQSTAGKALATFGNWVHVNKQGMTFGLLLATVLLALLPLVRLASNAGSLSATFAGFLMGVPMGLCVNCSAPVAYGLYRGGSRVETMLATMLGSPSLNVVVLSMAFALLPLHLVVVKLALSLVLILAVVPLLARCFPAEQLSSHVKATPASCDIDDKPFSNRWPAALYWVGRQLLQSLGFILLKMLPLMLLAGAIGAVLVTFLPWESLDNLLPRHGTVPVVCAMILLALFGLMLPVPVAFDVILVVTLVSAGLADKYAAILLFSLGSFSVYSFFVLLRAGVPRLAIGIAVSVAAMSFGAGVVSHYWGQWDNKHRQQAMRNAFAAIEQQEDRTTAIEPGKLLAQIEPPPPLGAHIMPGQPDILVTPLVMQEPAMRWQMQPVDIGLHARLKPRYAHGVLPFMQFNGIAAGDFNADGWQDLVLADLHGLHLFMNTGGRFQAVSIPEFDGITAVSVAAFIDIDNDGWQDLIFSQLHEGHFAAYNHQGQFTSPVKLADNQAQLAFAAAFADLDRDGDLDILWGNHNSRFNILESEENSRNQLLINQGQRTFNAEQLPGQPGETLTLFATRLFPSASLDVLVGNDFEEPDVYYRLDASGPGLHWQEWKDARLPEMVQFTMSIDSADLDNDLDLEMYHAQITRNPSSPPFRIPQVALEDATEAVCRDDNAGDPCMALQFRQVTQSATRKQSLMLCNQLAAPERWDCVASVGHKQAFDEKRRKRQQVPQPPLDCGFLAKNYPALYRSCQHNALAPVPTGNFAAAAQFPDAVPQQTQTNALWFAEEQGWQDRASAWGADISGWSWNAKFADLDGDQWQDLFIVNGFFNELFNTPNLLFKNIQGQGFNMDLEQSALADHEPTLSYSYLDFDNDGDLDIVTYSAGGTVKAYQNQSLNHHLQIEIRDHAGNGFGLGAQIIVRYGDEQNPRQQIRELKAGGGYLSFDPAVAHFGLGAFDKIRQITVIDIQGQQYSFDGVFSAGQRYQVHLNRTSAYAQK